MSEESTTDWPEPSQTPLFYAVHSERYARQTQIEEYEGRVNRSLIVIKGPIHDGLIPPLSDALSDVDYESPIDLMVTSGGGIPEVALKMATMCRGVNGQRQDMRIVVPEIAASAATILALAADSLLMSDMSSLGPIDPQLIIESPGNQRLVMVPAKHIKGIVEEMKSDITSKPALTDFYKSFVPMNVIDGLLHQRALAALEGNTDIAREALSMRRDGPDSDISSEIIDSLQREPEHSAMIGPSRAKALHLPVEYVDPQEPIWRYLWRLHLQYSTAYPAANHSIVEGRRVSFVWNPSSDPGV